MTTGSTGLWGVRVAAAALLILTVIATGCERPPDEAWLRFLGFWETGSSSSTAQISVLEGNLNDKTTDSADAVLSNVSVTVGVSGGGAGTGILVTNARVVYRMTGFIPPPAEYPLNLYLGPSSHTNGTATGTATAGRTSLPLATASLKQWLIDTRAFDDPSATPTVNLTANVTFFAETDDGNKLETAGSIGIALSTQP